MQQNPRLQPHEEHSGTCLCHSPAFIRINTVLIGRPQRHNLLLKQRSLRQFLKKTLSLYIPIRPQTQRN